MIRFGFFVLFTTCIRFSTFSQSEFTLFLIGDAGETSVNNAPYKKVLQEQLQNGNSAQAIVFLGDNIYPKGMPEREASQRKESEDILTSQIALVKDVQGDVYFIPGNHDWKQGRREGWERIQHQQQFIDSLKDTKINFLPKGGCPGPVEVHLSEQLVLIILDTQWILHPFDKPEGENSSCESKTSTDIITQLEDILKRNKEKRIVIVGHHPIYTYGEHGGVFTLKDHLFPLTAINKRLYLPLPVLGSIYPLYRKIFGNIQDTSHPVYKQFRLTLARLLKEYPGVIYASGHEHTLQYSLRDSIHYVVSGSGVKSTHAKKKGFAQFVSSKNGFVKLTIKEKGDGKIEYWDGQENLFSKELQPIIKTDNSVLASPIKEGLVSAKASERYEASISHERWLGENYRREWSQEIKAPVFDITKERGGLKIIQRGGGMQTLSLRLEDSLGREYTLRSIEKFPEKAVPEAFRKTFAQDLVQDQISAAHPYGAVVVPFLAEAAGIYHTNPKVVYIPDDPHFGIYRKDFSNQLMLFEERPSGSGKGMDFFGNAEKIMGIDKLLEKLAADNDNQVDQQFVLRSRLFDLWIGDWDRHDDQWRWAEWEDKKGKTYRPIPRDRDQAFFVNEGRIPKYWSKPWLLPKFEGFKETITWPSGLMFNGRYFDRSFLTGLTKQDWIEMAEDLAAKMTDDVIETAIRQWPEEIYQLHGSEIVQRLKARRSKLKEYAVEHYFFLAREVEVVGSNKNEQIEIEHQPDGELKIQVFKLTKEGDKGKKLYQRTFLPDETSEVRIYGLGGEDLFVVKGEGSKIKVRIIGGEGLDKVDATAKGGTTMVYDTKEGALVDGENYKDRRSDEAKVNEYNRKSFVYNRYAPLLYGNYNIDDGIFVGGGFLITTNGFRKIPNKSKHLFLGSVALNTASFNFKYDGRFNQVIGKWNVEIDADVKSPNFVNNFFGWGNETVFDKEIDQQPGIEVEHPIDYYRVRFREYAIQVKLAITFGAAGFFKVGPAFQHIAIEETTKDRYINNYAAVSGEPILDVGKNFTGLTYSWGFDKRNHQILTTRGVYFQQTSRWMEGLKSASDFAAHTASLSFYQTFRFPARITFAFRAGAGLNNGSYEFYQAQILDGKTDIRGFRKTRFYGDAKLFFNNEVRIKLASFRSYLFPASFGITGFYDVGRVWYKDVNGVDSSSPTGTSEVWHKGFGGGLWFTPYNLTVLSMDVAHSIESTLFYIRLGFLF